MEAKNDPAFIDDVLDQIIDSPGVRDAIIEKIFSEQSEVIVFKVSWGEAANQRAKRKLLKGEAVIEICSDKSIKRYKMTFSELSSIIKRVSENDQTALYYNPQISQNDCFVFLPLRAAFEK